MVTIPAGEYVTRPELARLWGRNLRTVGVILARNGVEGITLGVNFTLYAWSDVKGLDTRAYLRRLAPSGVVG
jgi:hypothetical protein